MRTNYEDTDRAELLAARLGKLIGFLGDTVIRTVALYLQVSVRSDGKLDSEALEVVKDQIGNSALAFRLVQREREIIEVLDGDLDPKPALALLRDVQDSLILLASQRPGYWQKAVPREQIQLALQEAPVAGFLSNVVGDATQAS